MNNRKSKKRLKEGLRKRKIHERKYTSDKDGVLQIECFECRRGGTEYGARIGSVNCTENCSNFVRLDRRTKTIFCRKRPRHENSN